jgi:hypothetical protein
MSIPIVKTSRRKQKQQAQGYRLTLCSIEVPLVVTSREHTWNEKPSPPSYDQVEEPPSYNSSLESLPRAPTYHNTETTTSTS